ncbi:MAG: histidinol dehydrogenase [Acidobacteria bacterium]|nr:MAG: histidinol dehydrogenase [Acidobacteriota bacterium]
MIELIPSKDHERLAAKLRRIRQRNVALDTALMEQVTAIIDEVRTRGDAALVEYAERFDEFSLQPSELRVNKETLREFAGRVDAAVLEGLREAIARVRRFHKAERAESWEIDGPNGVRLGQRITPIDRVGVYVPGGTAAYPSSVVMNVVPAQVAGVERIVIATPPRTLNENPAVAAALCELGIDEVYAVGGAQAVAALAYGTETVPPVDKITGPGNKYVAAAKKLVFGVVGIDSIAGPSEVIVLADDTARASFVAADLLAQAEHSEDACAILITTSDTLAEEVARELEAKVAALPRREIIKKSLAQYGAIMVVEDLNEACNLVNEIAPEHLEIMSRDVDRIVARIRNAGAIFFGDYSPEAVGDYLAGPNHVLPTARTARFSSALGVHDFIKRTNTVKFSVEEMRRTARVIATLARVEGLEAHAQSTLIRLDE